MNTKQQLKSYKYIFKCKFNKETEFLRNFSKDNRTKGIPILKERTTFTEEMQFTYEEDMFLNLKKIFVYF